MEACARRNATKKNDNTSERNRIEWRDAVEHFLQKLGQRQSTGETQPDTGEGESPTLADHKLSDPETEAQIGTDKSPCGLSLEAAVAFNNQFSEPCAAGVQITAPNLHARRFEGRSYAPQDTGRRARVSLGRAWRRHQWRRRRNVQPRKCSTRKQLWRWLSRTNENIRSEARMRPLFLSRPSLQILYACPGGPHNGSTRA